MLVDLEDVITWLRGRGTLYEQPKSIESRFVSVNLDIEIRKYFKEKEGEI